ncbi:MAG TPA: hypothetical protein VGA96_07535, partial [Fibrella sp.]
STVVYRDIYPNCEGTQQTITFPTLTSHIKTDAPFRPIVSSSSGLPISLYTVGGPAFMEGRNVRLTGYPGLVTLRAVQSGSATFRPAQAVERSFLVVNFLSTIADIAVSAAFGKQVAGQQSPVSLSLTVTNSGPDAATNVKVTSRLPNGLAFMNSTAMTHQSGVVSGLIASIPTGHSETVEMFVKPSLPGSYVLQAEVTASQAVDPDSQPGSGTGDGEDDMAQATLRTTDAGSAVFISPNPNQRPLPDVVSNQPAPEPNRVDLSLKLQSDTRTARVSKPLTVTLTVTNTGSLTATDIVVRDTLSGFTLSVPSAMNAISSGADYSVVGTTIATLAPMQSATLVFTVLPTRTGALRTAAQVWSVGKPTQNPAVDADSTPGNGVANGEDDCDQISWRSY